MVIDSVSASLRRIEFGSIAVIRSSNMVLGFALAMVTTWYLTSVAGEAGFALYAVLVSILASLPFADLGLGAGVVNATSDFTSGRISRTAYTQTLRRTLSILCGVCLVLIACSVAVGIAGLWPALLGPSAGTKDAGLAATVVGVALAVSVPLGMGSRVLQGASRTRLWAGLMFVGSGIQGVILVVMMMFHAPPEVFVAGPSLSLIGSNLVTAVVGLRAVGVSIWDLGMRTGEGMPGELHVRKEYQVVSSALPYLITMVGVTLTLQLQRILLSHVSSTHEVAEYAFVSQFTVAVNSVITLGSLNLWSSYRELRTAGIKNAGRVWQDTKVFSVVGIVVAVAVCGVVAVSAGWLTGGNIAISWQTYAGAWALVVIWAMARPGIMFLNYPRGFWFQAVWAMPCAAASLALTIYLGGLAGASGAFVASAFAIFVFTVLPNAAMTARELMAGSHGRSVE